ncbi:hypothetical protein [Komagataeibacter xylinus]|nr:hypothetical protein [Komagataeibacter xylinus]
MIEKCIGGRHDPLLQAAMASPLDTEVFGEAFSKKGRTQKLLLFFSG